MMLSFLKRDSSLCLQDVGFSPGVPFNHLVRERTKSVLYSTLNWYLNWPIGIT